MVFILIAAALLIISINCNKTEPIAQDVVETFRGSYFAADDSLNIGQQKTDSLQISITNNRFYTILFFDPFAVEFCDHNGEVAGFGTNEITFTPGTILGSNCDQLRIPRGVFAADFVTHGDTIYIDRSDGIKLYRLKLLK